MSRRCAGAVDRPLVGVEGQARSIQLRHRIGDVQDAPAEPVDGPHDQGIELSPVGVFEHLAVPTRRWNWRSDHGKSFLHTAAAASTRDSGSSRPNSAVGGRIDRTSKRPSAGMPPRHIGPAEHRLGHPTAYATTNAAACERDHSTIGAVALGCPHRR